MRLSHITSAGTTAETVPALPQVATEVLTAYAGLYRTHGFIPPWLGYLALVGGMCVGTCGFKAPPKEGRVEIAYFTFPVHERRGYATQMARLLVEIAHAADPYLNVAARTMPQESASTTILKKLDFELLGPVVDPEDGVVWEWQRAGKV